MRRKTVIMGLALGLSVTCIRAQEQPANGDALKDSVQVNELAKQSKAKLGTDPLEAMNLAEQAITLAQKIGYVKGEATALKNKGTSYYFLGKPDLALLTWQEALKLFERINDDIGVADLLGNIGIFYYNRGDDVKALDNYLKSLKIAERIGYKKGIVSALNNTGGVYYYKGKTYDKALRYYLQALPICEEMGDKNSLGAISVNVGNIYLKQHEHAKALKFFNDATKAYSDNQVNIPTAYNGLGALYLDQKNYPLAEANYAKALSIGEKTDNKLNMVRSMVGLAAVYMDQDKNALAINYFKKAEATATGTDAALELEDLYQNMAVTYSRLFDYANAFKYQTLFTKIKDSLYNVDYDKKVATLQFDFELEKKQGQINLLTKDKALRDQQLKQQRFAKNAFAVGLGMVFIILFVIVRGYRNKVRTNKILDHQKEEIEGLLLNILPAEVAHELQATGRATPRSYDHVSVLFTDFKGFTTIADKLSPEDLVHELNSCFMAFDEIIEKYNLEKIKTIGDSYMCAGGIPTPDSDHPYRIVKASLEIQQYIFNNNQRRKAEGLETWDIRIGIHVGPVVAGVVGKKKYAYDVWGSSVNIASRMESSGIPGQVNISAATHEIIKNKFACIYRGKIYAKNVGDIDMYLVDHELDAFRMGEVEKTEKAPQPTIIPG